MDYVSEKGLLLPRSGVTERDDQGVCIECTWNAQGVDPGRQIPRESRARTPITSRKGGEPAAFCFQENRRVRELHETVPQTNTGGVVEKTKANGSSRVKELGKKASVTSG